uniref:Uncharacterized protein n=1 Tax=Rhizophora mucronata TaxID=61149 RepID=A0A2P2L7R9_RHIMU
MQKSNTQVTSQFYLSTMSGLFNMIICNDSILGFVGRKEKKIGVKIDKQFSLSEISFPRLSHFLFQKVIPLHQRTISTNSTLQATEVGFKTKPSNTWPWGFKSKTSSFKPPPEVHPSQTELVHAEIIQGSFPPHN